MYNFKFPKSYDRIMTCGAFKTEIAEQSLAAYVVFCTQILSPIKEHCAWKKSGRYNLVDKWLMHWVVIGYDIIDQGYALKLR